MSCMSWIIFNFFILPWQLDETNRQTRQILRGVEGNIYM